MKHLLLLGSMLLLGCGVSVPNEASDSHGASDQFKPLHLDWRYSLHSQVASTPVVSGNQLLVAAENGNLYAFDKSLRQLSWLHHVEGGIASTPVVADGKIYFLSRDGFFYALEQTSGKRLWRFATGGEGRFAAVGGYGLPADIGPVPDPWDFYLSSPLVHNGKVYFGSTDKHLYALDAINGALLWSFQADEAIHSSPVINNGKVFFGSWGTKLYALNADTGAELWHFQGGVDPQYFAMQGMTAAPLVDDNNVYIGARDGFVYALRQADGALAWRYDAAYSWVLASAAQDEQQLYIATSDTTLLLALDKQTGAEKYRADTRVWTYATPLLVQDRTLFVATMTGELYGFDKHTGKKLWYYQTPEGRADINDIVDDQSGKLRGEKLFAAEMQVQAGVELVKALGAFVASPIWADNELIVVTATGELLVFNSNKRGR